MPKLSSTPHVVLIWPGGLMEPAGIFGVPQVLNLAQAVRGRTGASVDVIDLDMERALGKVDLVALCAKADLVGISCYSSFDYLKVVEIARYLKREMPHLRLVTGGYHPSARPADFTRPDSPFDFVIVGDGEVPLSRLIEHLGSGRLPLQRVLGPESLPSPREVMPYDWSLLDRYKPIARQAADQVELYLSRGCPYDCSFCMERAKRDTAWRAVDPEEGVEELHRLDRYLDLSTWTLRISDPLFGMKRTWRRAFLEELARRPVRARKVWLVLRVDLVEREDFALMQRANVAVGFGLESGDPGQLRRIRKTGMLSTYLDKMMQIAEWAREYQVPFGSNIIVGHPGETEASLRTSARFMQRLFLEGGPSYGFLAVDPFRLYPGSPIADDLETWQEQTGMIAHRYPWWEDGDQAFLAEWVDPSAELTYERRTQLTEELFAPIVQGIRSNFGYTGPASDYFVRAIDREIEQFKEPVRQQRASLHALWCSLVGKGERPRLASERRDDIGYVAPAPEWARAVCHVLAHIAVPEMPASLYDPVYIRHAQNFLGPATERGLGAFCQYAAESVTSHAEYARLQALITRFDSIAFAAESLPLLAAAELASYGPLGAALCAAVLEEATFWARLPVLRPDPDLEDWLKRLHGVAPRLTDIRVQTIDSLRLCGRLVGQVIWIGTPCAALDVAAEAVAWQAAHEAVLAEVLTEMQGQGHSEERELEDITVKRLASRRRRLEAEMVETF